jgi:hypothetical protein
MAVQYGTNLERGKGSQSEVAGRKPGEGERRATERCRGQEARGWRIRRVRWERVAKDGVVAAEKKEIHLAGEGG